VTLVVETSAQEAVATWDSATTRVKDTEDRAALTERETQKRVLRVEAESTAVLASALDETEGLV
jgi:urease accessory protein UreE